MARIRTVKPELAAHEGLFDLEQDPGETRNLFDDRPAEAQRMRRDLELFLSRQDSTLAKKAIKGENAEVRARLAALVCRLG